MSQSNRWDRLDSQKFLDEGEAIARLLASRPLSPEARKSIVAEAAGLVEGARAHARRQGVVESFLKEFSLGTKEGLALMCLAEALLRTPDAETRDRLRSQPLTVIETWGLPDEPIDVAIGFSHSAAGDAMARFLRSRGYRRPHLIVPNSTRSQRRATGFAQRWIAEGGEEPTRLEVNIPSHFGQGRLSFRALADLPAMPDVVVCGSDWIAQGLIVEAQAAGVRVPDKLAVTGFGNLRMAGDMRPTITSVDVDGGRVAREAIRVLRARAAGEKITERRIDVGFRIIARESA